MMTVAKLTIRPATIDDAPALSRLVASTFRETFKGENTPGDMAQYLAEAFTLEQQATELTDPASVVLLAEHDDESGDAELVGYAHLVSGPVPDAVHGPAPLELKRLYVVRVGEHTFLLGGDQQTDWLLVRPITA